MSSSLTSREPAVLIGLATTAVAAVLALIVAFGGDLTKDQQSAILGVIAAVAPIVTAALIRPKVTPANFRAAADKQDRPDAPYTGGH